MLLDEPLYPAYVSSDTLDRAFDRIAQGLFDFRAEFLFGAGMSVPSHIPCGQTLAEALVRKFFPSVTDALSGKEVADLACQYPLEAVASALESAHNSGRRDLTELLRSLLFVPPKKYNEAHELFLSISQWEMEPRIKRVFTTNFDDLLEQCFGRHGQGIDQQNYATIRDVERNRRTPIIHLHGLLCADRETDYEITEQDAFRPDYNPLHALFRSALAEADAFVFVGYSMVDPDFRALFMRYRDDMQDRGRRAHGDKNTYIVSPCETARAYELGATIWRTRGAFWIPMTARDFFMKLRLFMEGRSGKDLIASLKTKFSQADFQGFKTQSSRVAHALRIDDGDATQFLMETRSRSGSVR